MSLSSDLMAWACIVPGQRRPLPQKLIADWFIPRFHSSTVDKLLEIFGYSTVNEISDRRVATDLRETADRLLGLAPAAISSARSPSAPSKPLRDHKPKKLSLKNSQQLVTLFAAAEEQKFVVQKSLLVTTRRSSMLRSIASSWKAKLKNIDSKTQLRKHYTS
ncbi:hypothetical protein LZ554_002251 [Drepanopeziza brunnea f. sp. 'monogermtubi']|nr:hypothetical protein LZ554_002251 [Drepanopeziza brunnea f. sp. 'monogermtubi']